MASRLKNRQRAQVEQSIKPEKTADSRSSQQTDRRPSTVTDDGDDFPTTPNIASKIAQRRLPRRTPTSHVKGVSENILRRRLSKTSEDQGSSVSSRITRYTPDSAIEKSFDGEPSNHDTQILQKAPEGNRLTNRSNF